MLLRFYPIVLFLQMFCLYHAYTNKTEQKWYWIIIFFPFLGSVFYLYRTFYSPRNVDLAKEEVKGTFIKNFKIEKLEKEVRFSNTMTNRLMLADAYSQDGHFDKALEIYKTCNEGIYKDEPDLLMKMLRNHYLRKDYPSVIEYGLLLESERIFEDSQEMTAFAWSYFHVEDFDRAEALFASMDKPFINYEHRLEYAYFYQQIGKDLKGKHILEKLLDEIDSMDAYEKRLKKTIHKQISGLYKQFTQ